MFSTSCGELSSHAILKGLIRAFMRSTADFIASSNGFVSAVISTEPVKTGVTSTVCEGIILSLVTSCWISTSVLSDILFISSKPARLLSSAFAVSSTASVS